MSKLGRMGILLCLFGVSLSVWKLHNMLKQDLVQSWMQSGWVLLLLAASFLLLLVKSILKKSKQDSSAKSCSRYFPLNPAICLLASGLLLLAFAVHTDFRYPQGQLERVLSVLFVASVLSCFVGSLVAGANSQTAKARSSLWALAASIERQWIAIHVPLMCTLLPLCVFHGVMAHAHGYLANTFGLH